MQFFKLKIQACNIENCKQNKAHLLIFRIFSGSIPEVTTVPQPLSCHQIKPHIRDPHEIWGRSGVIKTKSKIWPKSRIFLNIRKIFETGSTRTYKWKHELYHKFDENHEYVVFLCVKWIFTELLTEMRKPEVEKKHIIKKSNKWALLVE